MEGRAYGAAFAVLLLTTGTCCAGNARLDLNAISPLGDSDLSSQVLEQLVQVLDSLTSLDERFTFLHGAVISLGESISALEARIDSRFDELKQHMDSRFAEPKEGEDVESQETTEKPSTPFRITRVTKTETSDQYHVNMEYESLIQPTVHLQDYYNRPLRPLAIQDVGRVEFDVSKQLGNDNPVVTFILPEHSTIAQLSLNNTPSAMTVPRIHLETNHGNDVIFARGQDPTVETNLEVGGDMDDVEYEDLSASLLARSDRRANEVLRYSLHDADSEAPVSIVATQLEGRKGRRHATLLINSTSGDVEGFLELSAAVQFNCSRNCLVQTVHTSRSLNVYRDDHDGPFPDDFIGFVHSYKDPDPLYVACGVREGHCSFYCHAVGHGILDISISRILPGGETVSTNDTSITISNQGFSQLQLEDAAPSDSGQYVCTARSQTREVTEGITVEVIQEPEINKELSTVTKHDNGSVSATCVATGNPAPNVTFDDQYSLNDIGQDNYILIMTHVNDNTTRVDIMISDPDKASDVSVLQCLASNLDNEESPYEYLFSSRYMMPVYPSEHDRWLLEIWGDY